ncbi:DEHA2A14498p [Debaryomyces hansenii CBS767]|uniref:DEHA2A14498p n=1 Tax=Debaryomyces hansenii (strain ATCC 36239 / CBS 767 / BCRC 21394 / JCM 1990 / NBRC 0083 / IGC 2968) TaxID=284592 RepID=B5RSN1_DEBHA|nr:DEHA2A14498p [Debaryomyces hansenii CBS767]CAR65416.1 DEHA2A14498p [Debaryomyces hansenii CBS767]|eukprot:XP_002770041.1 DEHA2A14498p [Debaryomyces hansenii CBS767]
MVQYPHNYILNYYFCNIFHCHFYIWNIWNIGDRIYFGAQYLQVAQFPKSFTPLPSFTTFQIDVPPLGP